MKYSIAAGLICAATVAHAMQHPVPATAGGDPHVQVAHYNPYDPVMLIGAIGRPVTISFSPAEHVRSVALDTGYVDADGKAVPAPWDGPDAEHMKDQPGNMLPLWPVRAGRSSAQITTSLEDGTTRTYQFVLVALPAQPDNCNPLSSEPDITLDCDDLRLAYGLSFIYAPERPKADPAAMQAAQVARLKAREAQQAKEKLAAEDRLKADIFYGPRNWKYVAKGTPAAQAALVPDQVSDNTAVTGLRFLGNRKAPAVYIVDPDGTERQVTPSTNGDLLVVQETARHWRLRAGSQVADLYNQGYDPIGANPQTGTTSPEVVRITREAQK
jgi:type IV secretion system protein VirB9